MKPITLRLPGSQLENNGLQIFRLALLGVVMLTFSACSTFGVQPWERDQLAKREMLLMNNPLEVATDDHIYFSREASSGGQSFGGGGCGCN